MNTTKRIRLLHFIKYANLSLIQKNMGKVGQKEGGLYKSSTDISINQIKKLDHIERITKFTQENHT